MNDDEEDVIDLARACVYRYLSLAASDPQSDRWKRLLDPEFQAAAAAAAEVLREQCIGTQELAPGELRAEWLDLSGLAARPGTVDRANQEYEQMFGLMMPKKCPPYETEYCPQVFSVYRAQRLADVAGFYRAFGLEPSRDLPERQDHVALELEFMSWLITKELHARSSNSPGGRERALLCREAQAKFFTEHLAWWVPAFAHALWRQAEGGADVPGMTSGARTFHGSLAQCLAAATAIERTILQVPPPTELVAPRPTEDAEAAECGQCCAGGVT